MYVHICMSIYTCICIVFICILFIYSLYLSFKICARSRAFAYSPSFLSHIFSQSNPTKNNNIKWHCFSFIPFHTHLSDDFLFERIQWLTSWAVWRVTLQRKCYSAKSKRPGRVGKRLQKVHGFFSLGNRPLVGNLAETVVPFHGRIERNSWSPRAPPTWKRTSIVMRFEILYFNVTKVKKRMHLQGGSTLPDWFLNMQG